MTEIRLSERLQTVLNQIPKGTLVADIGTDHAYLPIAVIQQGVTDRVIAGDVRNGPWQAAVTHIEEAGLSEHIDIRLGDGLDVLAENEAEVITICGMGGALMTELLERGHQTGKLQKVIRMVLQPNIGEAGLRKWLRENQWDIQREKWLEEDGFVYPILTVDRLSVTPNDEMDHALSIEFEKISFAESVSLSVQMILKKQEWLDLLGVWNLHNPSLPWWKRWKRELEQMESIIRSLEQNARTTEALERQRKLTNDVEILKEVLRAWYVQESSQIG